MLVVQVCVRACDRLRSLNRARCVALRRSGALRDTIVSFGEQLPAAALATATAKSAAAAVFVVLGSSLRVTPAADLPALAMSNGCDYRAAESCRLCA